MFVYYLYLQKLLVFISISSGLGMPQNFLIFQTTPATTTAPRTAADRESFALVNNQLILRTITPFVQPKSPTVEFLDCFGRCPTTSEYNPICASNMQIYLNEQKFNCARFCGIDIEIVRRGSCAGLFPMQRG